MDTSTDRHGWVDGRLAALPIDQAAAGRAQQSE